MTIFSLVRVIALQGKELFCSGRNDNSSLVQVLPLQRRSVRLRSEGPFLSTERPGGGAGDLRLAGEEAGTGESLGGVVFGALLGCLHAVDAEDLEHAVAEAVGGEDAAGEGGGYRA